MLSFFFLPFPPLPSLPLRDEEDYLTGEGQGPPSPTAIHMYICISIYLSIISASCGRGRGSTVIIHQQTSLIDDPDI